MLRRFNVELNDQMMDRLLGQQDLLRIVATSSTKTGHPVLHRFVHELQWQCPTLRPLLSLFASPPTLRRLRCHEPFAFDSFAVALSVDGDDDNDHRHSDSVRKRYGFGERTAF